MAEQGFRKAQVGGSSPLIGSKGLKRTRMELFAERSEEKLRRAGAAAEKRMADFA